MRASIVKSCTCVCGPGSIVEVSPDQFLALGNAAVRLEGDDVPKLGTKTKKAKKAKTAKATTKAKKE